MVVEQVLCHARQSPVLHSNFFELVQMLRRVKR